IAVALLSGVVFVFPARADPGGASSHQVTPDEQARQAVVEAQARARNNDLAGVISTLQPIVGTPAFASLPNNYKYASYLLLSLSYFQQSDFAHALPMARQATALSNYASGVEWNIRFWSAFQVHEREE